MYWPIQEKAVFIIIFLIVFVMQMVRMFIFREKPSTGLIVMIAAFNLAALVGLIYYAKWVWRPVSVLAAFKKVILFEVVFVLSVIIFLALY